MRHTCTNTDYYVTDHKVFSTVLQLLQSLSNNYHWALVIDTTIFELLEPAPNDFHLYNHL